MDKKKLEKFLIKARLEGYAKGGGKVTPALSGSTQLEYKEGDFLYRDVYYTGKNTFNGMDTVYYKDKPVFATSYYGNWGEMTEEEIDSILRGALVANPETRLYKKVTWKPVRQAQGKKDGFVYDCTPDSFSKSISEIGGYESISKDGDEVYRFYYAGSILI